MSSACVPWANLSAGNGLQLRGPATPAAGAAWLADMRRWRSGCLAELRLNGSAFDALRWARTAFMQPLAMPFDLYIYNSTAHEYTAKRYLDSLRDQYGGADSVLLWPTYTNIGADDRNQFELIESLPGGVAGLRRFIDELHSAGVHVLWPYNPWDQGTHGGSFNNSAAAASDARRLASLLSLTGADGFFGDTISSAGHAGSSGLEQFYRDSVAAGRPAAIQPEGGGTAAGLNFTVFGWGYWAWEDAVPPVDLLKWLRPAYLTQACDRWRVDKTDVLQLAYFNGDGVETWQSIWGVWNGLTARDGEALRRMSAVLRFFGREGYLQSDGWRPHAPLLDGSAESVFASAWPLDAGTVTLLINRATADGDAALPVAGGAPGHAYAFDCYRGEPLLVSEGAARVSVEGRGFGCVWQSVAPPTPAGATFLRSMRALAARGRLDNYSEARVVLHQRMAPRGTTRRLSSPPEGMVVIPPTGAYRFVVAGQEIEGRAVPGVDVQYPWEAQPGRTHDHTMAMPKLYMDATPVTCAAFASYLSASGYVPADGHNFLRSWNASGPPYVPPAALAPTPVTYVSLREARAFCAFHGKRLPTSYEWQYAAQGDDGRPYPWGDSAECAANGTCCPALTPASRAPWPVEAHPSGSSPFGVRDLVGNVWQLTDEFEDEHTRAVVVRGGSYYAPRVPSGDRDWYFPNGPAMRRLDTHGKYFLMDDSYERAGTIGFRCVVDAA